jgi:SAM-dependent methyltransferase
MNLCEMQRHKDPNLVLSTSVTESIGEHDGDYWKGFQISPDSAPQIRLRGAPGWHPFRERPDFIGWMACSPANGVLETWFAPAGRPDVRLGPSHKLHLSERLLPIRLPWPLTAQPLPDDSELVLHARPSNESPVFLGIHRLLDRGQLIRLAQGRGAEIGPGSHPQVLPGPNVEVIYVEQTAPDQWVQLYDPKGTRSVDKSLWDFYKIGTADNLPAEDGSLDFVFSSHVFEHLANPLGHLAHWHSKLRPGGLILGVVPDVAGWKDYAFHPCKFAEILNEYETGTMSPSLSHYQRWVKARQLKTDPGELLRSGRSIHIHFYTHSNMAELLRWAVDHLGFGYFHIRHTPNAKDFHFLLAKSERLSGDAELGRPGRVEAKQVL